MKLHLDQKSDLGEILTRDELKKVMGGMTGSEGDYKDPCPDKSSTTKCFKDGKQIGKNIGGTGCPYDYPSRCDGSETIATCACVLNS